MDLNPLITLGDKLEKKVVLSCVPETLCQGRDHFDWYQNVAFSSIYHNTRFEANRFINVRIHVNVKLLLFAVSETAVI